MKEDKIAACFKEKLREYECEVPEQLWDKVEAGLPPVSRFRTHRRRYYCLAGAAAVALVVGVLSFWKIWHETPSVQDKPDAVIMADGYVPHHMSLKPDKGEERNLVQEQSVAPLRSLYAEAQPSAADTSSRETGRSEEVAEEPVRPEKHHLAIADKPAKIVLPKILSDDTLQYDHTAYAAVMSSAGKSLLPRNWLSVKANAMRSDVSPVQYIMRAGAQEIVYRHKMPLSVTASFEKRFGRWGVGTGVAYTFMTSNYEMADNQRRGTQTLHYLGVPLYVSFHIAQVKRFSFYASAGGEVDFNIAGVQKESSESQAFHTMKEKKVRDKKPQLSVQARVGAAFELMRHLDLYIEPTLGYYFHHESPIHSVWSDRPWNVSLSLGVRTGF